MRGRGKQQRKRKKNAQDSLFYVNTSSVLSLFYQYHKYNGKMEKVNELAASHWEYFDYFDAFWRAFHSCRINGRWNSVTSAAPMASRRKK